MHGLSHTSSLLQTLSWCITKVTGLALWMSKHSEGCTNSGRFADSEKVIKEKQPN